MEASTTQTPTPAEEVAARSDATRPVGELFRFSTWVHVGPDAENCEDGRDGTCGDPRHFHAWVRLPNQFQHQDIRERSMAAKARRLRQLRDPDSDAYAVMAANMEELARGDREALLDELVNKEWWRTHLDAMADVEGDDEFAHIDRDRERLAELQDSDAAGDELNELERHLRDYGERVDARVKEIQRPHRETLDAKSMDELVDLVREQRVQAEASAAFMDSYSKWQWLAGTFNVPPAAGASNARHVFASVEDLENAAPEVVEELRAVYGDLEMSLQRGARGNS